MSRGWQRRGAFPPVEYSHYAGQVGRRCDVVTKDACESADHVADHGDPSIGAANGFQVYYYSTAAYGSERADQ